MTSVHYICLALAILTALSWLVTILEAYKEQSIKNELDKLKEKENERNGKISDSK